MGLSQEDEGVRTYSELVGILEGELRRFMDVEAERFASAVSMFTPPPLRAGGLALLTGVAASSPSQT